MGRAPNLVDRIWNRDPLLWKSDRAHEAVIKNRLGWLDVVSRMQKEADDIRRFSLEIKGEGIQSVVLLGMGGSSLCPAVFKNTFGKIEGFPELHVLDTTDPATISDLEHKIDLKKTLFIVSSKSGGTIETDSLLQYFYDKASRAKQYIAITDAGTPLDKLAQARKFRRIFRNPSDIGGRYSALSYFGLVPAALMGLDLRRLLESARSMTDACRASLDKNPGAILGTKLGEHDQQGRDKVTFVIEGAVRSFGTWVEQLLAESTGKEGKGLVPIEGEPLGPPGVYGNDRVFVHVHLRGSENPEISRQLKALETANHPIINIPLENSYDLGGEFFRWEFATAVVGSILGIDPFDEPNVQESKDNTKAILEIYTREKKLPPSADPQNLAELLASAKPRDYVALVAFVPETGPTSELLRDVRVRLRDSLRIATTVGYGPRFLHSTGQLHKGGKNNGLFIQLTADDAADLKIPGEPYGFSVLKSAQALGDYQSLEKHGRRVIRIHLGGDIESGRSKILGATCKSA